MCVCVCVCVFTSGSSVAMMLVNSFLPSGVSSKKVCSVTFHREQFSWLSREMIYWRREEEEGEEEEEGGRSG